MLLTGCRYDISVNSLLLEDNALFEGMVPPEVTANGLTLAHPPRLFLGATLLCLLQDISDDELVDKWGLPDVVRMRKGHPLDKSVMKRLSPRRKKGTTKYELCPGIRQLFEERQIPWPAFVLSDEFAFLHVWKCGGTTVELMAGKQLRLTSPVIQTRAWVALVRDPIDHFLSGWAEDGVREPKIELKHNVTQDYDKRVHDFLQVVKGSIWPTMIHSVRTYAFPQASFMMDDNGRLYDNLMVVGDLTEMQTVLEDVVDFQKWKDGTIGRNASANDYKQKVFPSRRDLLSDETILDLCDFLKVDYFLFDFEPPAICTEKGGPLEGWWGKA